MAVEPMQSARVLGEKVGLTAMEMNLVLKAAGILEGEPGLYSITGDGGRFASETYHSRSPKTGHDVITLDPAVLAELDLSPEAKEWAREEATAIRRQRREQREAEAIDIAIPDVDDSPDEPGIDPRVVFGVLVVATLGVYGVVKAAPRVKRWWADRNAQAPEVEAQDDGSANDLPDGPDSGDDV